MLIQKNSSKPNLPPRPAATAPKIASQEPQDQFDGKAFRKTVGQFASGVAVVTTEDSGGERSGMTVSSFTSLSLDPPLVLFCAKDGSHTLDEVKESGHFAVNVLSRDQKDVCYGFAGQDGNKFDNVTAQPGAAHGDPLLQGSLATLECRLESLTDGGDHTIVIGRVDRFEQNSDDQPLLFWDGQVHQNQELERKSKAP
jgi:3-hydroxy-9,10-secoandrosta-1,3,5(10)-triene-9,17-dione monooxygenase reductase component